ncbi:hypothetical protein [Schlesneria sp.]|uniref:hypothetical protein n=1 Tax=Schlesneria sp. TaxID=2762018 RepID=UPI002F0B1E44
MASFTHFGVLSDPVATWGKYLDQKDELQAGRVPRSKIEAGHGGATILNLVNEFLAVNEQLKDDGELSA